MRAMITPATDITAPKTLAVLVAEMTVMVMMLLMMVMMKMMVVMLMLMLLRLDDDHGTESMCFWHVCSLKINMRSMNNMVQDRISVMVLV